MDFTKSFTVKNGDVITVAAHSDEKIANALRLLKKKGIRVDGVDMDLEKNLEFKLALAGALLVKVERRTPSNDLVEVPAKELPDFIAKTPNAADWIINKSRDVAVDAASYFEEETKNF